MDTADAAPFSIQFVRVPYDVEAELAATTGTSGCPSAPATRPSSARDLSRNLTELEDYAQDLPLTATTTWRA